MANPVRYPQGVNNTAKGSTTRPVLWNLPTLDPTKLIEYFVDFTSNNEFPDVTNDYTKTVTEAGAGSHSVAYTDGHGGQLLITNDAADNDAVFFNKKGEFWLPAVGSRAWFKARFKVSDATQSDFVMGLQVTDTTPLDATDGIYFQKDDGDTQLDVYCRKDATTGSTSATNIATVGTSFMTVGFFLDGRGKVWYYVDDVEKGYLDASSTYLPDTELTISFGIQNGEAVAKTMTVDYIYFAAER